MYSSVGVFKFYFLALIILVSAQLGEGASKVNSRKILVDFLERDVRENEGNEIGPLKLSIFYETRCPYSTKFIRDQLVPVWRELGAQQLRIQFVPYGNAHTFFKSGMILTGCQHGEQECLENKVHACALQYLPTDLANNFIFCAMSSDDSSMARQNCSETFIPPSYNFTEVIEPCATGYAGDLLLAIQGLMSLDFVTEGVPAVAIDGLLVEDDQILDNLLLYVCVRIYQVGYENPNFNLPPACIKAFEAETTNWTEEEAKKIKV